MSDDDISSLESDSQPDLVDRLGPQCEDDALNEDVLALHGERVPSDEHLMTSDYIRKCFISRIRKNLDFAKSSDTVETCRRLQGSHPELTRTRHARLIMSDEIPIMHNIEHFPYCIWFPDLASEATYAGLARKYPDLRYNVGRACAVAGFTELYRSLDLLPDVSIAEEARDNDAGSEVFELIMSRHTRYAVMNDYTRSVNLTSPHGSSINNDTAVRSGFSVTKNTNGDLVGGSNLNHWDILEDGWVAEGVNMIVSDPPLKPDYVHLLYSPLPRDLPPLNKDILILMAAYEHNIDRYCRLQRPKIIDGESYCIIRGIHHSTMFAKWWSVELASNPERRRRLGPELHAVLRAINARYIMSNDLSRIMRVDMASEQPYMIWHPQLPDEATLKELARVRPEMRGQVAHACIVGDYRQTWDTLNVSPHPVLYLEAMKYGHDGYFASDLRRRAREQNIDLERRLDAFEMQEAKATRRNKEPTLRWLVGLLNVGAMDPDQLDEGLYTRGYWYSSAKVDLHVCTPDDVRQRAAKQAGGFMMLNVLWGDDLTSDEDAEDFSC